MTPLSIISSPAFYIWLLALCASWAALAVVFGRVSYFKDKPKATAHQVILVVPFVFLAVNGTWLWFFDPEFALAFKDDKVFGYYAPCERLVLVMLAFQIWDFFVTLLMTTELKGQMQHLIHHASSTTLCTLGLLNGPHGFLLYYAPFFFGVSEISSLPLAFMDLFKYSKELTNKFPQTNEAIRSTFAVLFLLLRCVYWPFVAVDFWVTTLNSSAPIWLRGIWYFFNIALTLLQYYWGHLIVLGIIKMIKGSQSDQAGLAQSLQPAGSELPSSQSDPRNVGVA